MEQNQNQKFIDEIIRLRHWLWNLYHKAKTVGLLKGYNGYPMSQIQNYFKTLPPAPTEP
ncbi:MAG: hypothetical protein PHC43_05835 [Candidatus Marinimicrobia bacterium]|nr:hypothetical protein [Candidatus Neomarinimicrobiota bacterium]MDD5230831.1 hypothetical protein [Candidatus Neomarinimicrobiota bacterium]MDD5540898.1 hypothetical protein [Candidatus Neomarinimicrobiota bacterium]